MYEWVGIGTESFKKFGTQSPPSIISICTKNSYQLINILQMSEGAVSTAQLQNGVQNS